MNGKMKSFLAAAAVSFGLTAPLALVSTAQAVPPAPELVQPTDQQIEQYADAAQEVAIIAAAYQPKLESATTEEQRMQIMQEADQEMVAKVQEHGLSVDDYNGISLAVQQDVRLREVVEQRIATP